MHAADAKVDDVEGVEAEVAKIVVDAVDEFLAREGVDPGFVRTAAGADLGDDDEVIGIGMERLADDLIGDVRTVEVAGVDVVDAGGDRLAQNGEGGVRDRAAAPIRAGRRVAWLRSPCGSRWWMCRAA